METFNSLFMVSPLLLGVLFFVAMLAGFIDSIAGGGGLLTIPALMAAGMSPANALATNKLPACGGPIFAAIYFILRQGVMFCYQKPNIALTFVCVKAGRFSVQYFEAVRLSRFFALSGFFFAPRGLPFFNWVCSFTCFYVINLPYRWL
ncbi:TSUP family transporter [Escherichia coli]